MHFWAPMDRYLTPTHSGAEGGSIVPVMSPTMIEEVHNALSRTKFTGRIAALKTSVGELMESLLSIAEVIQEPRAERVIPEDPDDDKILACAISSHARWIVSGDHHLLAMKQYKGILILTPKQFWERKAKWER